MYDISRFCLSAVIASLAATVLIGGAAWLWVLITDTPRNWLPSLYHFKLLGIVGAVVACVGSAAAAVALLLSDQMFSRANANFLTIAGSATGLASIALVTPASNIHYVVMFTVAGAIGGRTFAQVWETSR